MADPALQKAHDNWFLEEPNREENAHECRHPQTRIEKGFDGNFVTFRTFCQSCGKLLSVENLLQGMETNRCPIDPRLDLCVTSCPVESGSLDVFEHPCLPVRKIMEEGGVKPSISGLASNPVGERDGSESP